MSDAMQSNSYILHESVGLWYELCILLNGDSRSQCHRYDIADLAEQGDFLDSAYLLLMGELPTSQQKADFDRELTLHTLVHEQLIQFFKGFKHDAHPMAIMVGVVGALAAFEPYSADLACAPGLVLIACWPGLLCHACYLIFMMTRSVHFLSGRIWRQGLAVSSGKRHSGLWQ